MSYRFITKSIHAYYAAQLYGGTTMINNSQRSLRALTMLATALLAFTAVSARTANQGCSTLFIEVRGE